MSTVNIVRAVDGAQYVEAEKVAGRTVIQVWKGGTRVNVYMADTGQRGLWSEINVWSLMDEEGKPEDQEAIEHHMAMHAAAMREEMCDE